MNQEPTTETGRIDLTKASDFAYIQDELFAEPQPWHDPKVGYRGTSAAAAAVTAAATGEFRNFANKVPCVRALLDRIRSRLGDERDLPVSQHRNNANERGFSGCLVVEGSCGDLLIHLAEILDPQGKAVAAALPRLGFTFAKNVRQGKRFEIEVEGEPTTSQLAEVERAAEKLLSNPVIENFTVRVEK